MRVTRGLPILAALLFSAACQATLPGSPPPTVVPTAQPTVRATPGVSPTAQPTVRATPGVSPTAQPTVSRTATPSADASPSPSLRPTASPPTAGLAPTGPTVEARVVRVVDGDTIRVRMGGQEYRLRYIGVNTPETVHPSRPVEWMGREASAANRELVDGRTVVLETDVSETDRFGRLLRHVWLADGGPDGGWLLVSLELVRRGLAQVSTYPPDVKYVDLFVAAQRAAREAGHGLWGEPPETDEPLDGGGSPCHPAYPTVCIPPPPPDLNCADIPHRRFTVLPPDPHRFDGDGDGVGCESG